MRPSMKGNRPSRQLDHRSRPALMKASRSANSGVRARIEADHPPVRLIARRAGAEVEAEERSGGEQEGERRLRAHGISGGSGGARLDASLPGELAMAGRAQPVSDRREARVHGWGTRRW